MPAIKHADILKKYETCLSFWGEIFERGSQDIDFVLGEQWNEEDKKARKGRPCLTENRMMPFVNQVLNQIRQAKPSIIPKPVDERADIDTAEILRGVIRNIETTSDADTVFDTASRNSVMGSVGWIRVITQYAGYDTFDQDVRLERIQNFQSVMLDPNHTRQDGSDAEYAFVIDDIDKEAFKQKYPDVACDGFNLSGWESKDSLRVAEYFYKVYEDKTLVEFEYATMLGTIREVRLKEEVPEGAVIIQERKTKVCKVKYAKLTATDIIEEGEFAGEYIPLVPVYGFEAFKEGKRTFYSLINQAKDPQRMLNYWNSARAEIVALQPKAPFIGAVGQFRTYKDMWASANNANFPFLEYDAVTTPEGVSLPAPMRQPPPTSSGTLMQESAMAADSIKAALGMYDASLGAQTADISGKAIISRQMQGDNATFHFVDNLAVAIRHVGRILIGLIPIIYTGQRIIRILGEDGKDSMVPLNQPVVKVGNEYKPAREVADQQVSRLISFDAGKYDVVVEVGASYATKRQELANAIVELARINPEIMNVAGDLFMKSLDVPYAEDIAKRIRSTMNPALLGDDLEAQRLQQLTQAVQELQNKLQLTEDALMAKQKDQEFQNMLDAKKVENDTKKIMIEAAKTEAEIEKIKSEINAPLESLNAIDSVLVDLQGKLADVTGALDVLLASEEGAGEATGMPEMPEMMENTDNALPSIGSV
jgi:hypothetical protein